MRLVVVFTIALANAPAHGGSSQRIYRDHSFEQDYSVKIPLSVELSVAELRKVRSDRNARIIVLSNRGLLQVTDGSLTSDNFYQPLRDMQIVDLATHRGQFIYLTDDAVLSNGWAGRFFVQHRTPKANTLQMGSDFDFLVLTDEQAVLFSNDPAPIVRWHGLPARENTAKMAVPRKEDVVHDCQRHRYLLLCGDSVVCLEPGGQPVTVFEGSNLNCLALTDGNKTLLAGTADGYIQLDANSFKPRSDMKRRLPCSCIRCIEEINDRVWFGTAMGTFCLRRDGQIDYYASKRWLVDDEVVDISKGPDGSVLILSRQGLSIICFKEMTLEAKASHFSDLTRKRHIRYGLNSGLAIPEAGDLATGMLVDEDNDGLWTAMYLAGELFRYAVTKSDEALQNCYESFEAMERLTQINPIGGFPSRSFERSGHQMADKQHWHQTEDARWVWKGTTSSDEIVGHFFAYTLFAELAPDEKWRSRAVALIDSIMDHIVRNDWYLIDYDGKPTQWGRWHPDYVNQFPRQVGDRRLNSVEIISFLQAAYHFTRKEVYKQKAFELLDKYGYLDNITTPVATFSRVPGISLTTEWNHSDDELAFLSYWNLYRYAFSEKLRRQYREAIKDHWQIERPEKNPLWNFIYAATGAKDFDLEEAVWTLREFPLDTISWTISNSHRKDLTFLEPNFRQQTTTNVLPPDERPMSKHNANSFCLDGGDSGRYEFSGDIYLLPYWMGRYLKIIKSD
jgi:hypothetical protein